MPITEVHIVDMTDVEIVAEAERRQAAGECEHAAELRRFIDWRHVPVVAHRRNACEWVILRLEDLLAILRESDLVRPAIASAEPPP